MEMPRSSSASFGIIYFRDDRAGHVLRAFDAVEGRIGLKRDAANFRIEFFQAASGAHEGSAGAHHRNEMSDTSFCLLPDFIGSAMVVCLPVGIVGILVGVEIFVGMLGEKFAGERIAPSEPSAGSV